MATLDITTADGIKALSETLGWVDVRAYGAIGDGVTDDMAAIQLAINSLSLTGGIIFLPKTYPNFYYLSGGLTLYSGIQILGAGIGRTILKNYAGSWPADDCFTVGGATKIGRGMTPVSGGPWAINAVAEGDLTITTTAAADAGNFSAGDYIALCGVWFGSNYCPYWHTTVISANAGTGVITLSERLPRDDFTQVDTVTVTKDMSISNLTIARSYDVGINAEYVENFRLHNIEIEDEDSWMVGVSLSHSSSRETRITGCKFHHGMGFHTLYDSHIIGNRIGGGQGITAEGGCEQTYIVGNTVTEAQTGLSIDTCSRRMIVTRNKFLNMKYATATVRGIVIGGANTAGNVQRKFGENIITHNILSFTGADNGDYGIVVDDSNDNIITHNIIKNFPKGLAISNSYGTVEHSNKITGWIYYAISNQGNTGQVNHKSATSVPTAGTYSDMDIIWHSDAASGEPLGWKCVTSGTFSAATDATGDTDGATAIITGMTDTSDFYVGNYVTVSAGFPTTGSYKIIAITATTITIDTNSNAAVNNITVSTPDPVFKAMANLA